MAKCSALVIAAVISIGLPSVAAAHGGNDDPKAVHACINNGSKIVRIVGITGSCLVPETPVHWGIQGQPGNDTRVFRYMTFDTFLESCCWNADNNAGLFGGVAPSTWTDNDGLAAAMSPDSDVLRTLFVRKLYPGNNALVSSERWTDHSSTNGKVTAVLMRIRNSSANAIDWQPFFYFTAYASFSERASVALNGVNVWNSEGDHHSDSTASPLLKLPANQTSTVIFVVPSSPPWLTGSAFHRMNFFAFFNNSLNLPPGLSFDDDLDKVVGSLW